MGQWYALLVSGEEREEPARRLTARGAVTRARIIDAASDLMYRKGVAMTTLDEVMAASGTGKSQFYQHFVDRDALVHEVLSSRARQVLEREERYLRRLDSFRGLDRWRQAVMQRVELRNGALGCELGSLAGELADQDEDARSELARHFATWEALLAAGFERMCRKGLLQADADPVVLATSIMAALQGGYLLAQITRDAAPMKIALDMAWQRVLAYAT